MQEKEPKEEPAPAQAQASEVGMPAANGMRHLKLVGEEWTPTTSEAAASE
jgi:hypothetical protein